MGIRDERKAATLRGIRAAALDLLEEQGFDAVTAGRIARRVGISERTIFRYVPSLEAAMLPTEGEFSQAIMACEIPSGADGAGVLRVLLGACREILLHEVGGNEFRRVSRLMAVEPRLLLVATRQEQELVAAVTEYLVGRGLLPRMEALLVGETLATAWRVTWQCFGAEERAGRPADPLELFDRVVASLAALVGEPSE